MSYLKGVPLAILSVFAPIQAVLLSALSLVAVDMALGIWAAIKRKETITSKGFGRSIVKLLVYEIALLCGHLVETYLIGGSLPLVKLVGGLIGLTEFKSILENLDGISGMPMFKGIVKTLESKSKKKNG